MKKYINTSNYYLSTIASKIEANIANKEDWHFDVSDVTADGVILPTSGYYWVDVDFGDVSKREIFRIYKREGYTLFYDKRISPYGRKSHQLGATVGLRDFSELLNSLSTNTDNFGEVEKVNETGFDIIVRGGKVFIAGSADNIVYIDDDTLSIPASSEVYVVLDFSDELGLEAAEFAIKESLTPDLMFPIARITTNATTITNIEDLRSTVIGGGDMRKAVYDPHPELHEGSDAFNYDDFYNVPTQETWDISDISDRNNKRGYWDDKQEELVGIGEGQNIVTINGKSIIDVSQWEGGNIPLDTILTTGWKTYITNNGIETFTFPDADYYPINEDAFMVFTDSGTALIRGGENPNDYTYDDTTHTITFNSPLYENEHAVIWVMYDASDAELGIGSGTIQLQRNGVTITNGQFNVNQDENQTIELGDLASNAQITFTQGGISDKTITLNQASNDTVALSGIIPVSQEDYEDLPDTKLTDNQWYFIIE